MLNKQKFYLKSLFLLTSFILPLCSMENQPRKKRKIQSTIGAYFKITKPQQPSRLIRFPDNILLHLSSFLTLAENGFLRSTCQETRSLVDKKRTLIVSTTGKKLNKKIKSLQKNNFLHNNPLQIKLAFNPQNKFLLNDYIEKLHETGLSSRTAHLELKNSVNNINGPALYFNPLRNIIARDTQTSKLLFNNLTSLSYQAVYDALFADISQFCCQLKNLEIGIKTGYQMTFLFSQPTENNPAFTQLKKLKIHLLPPPSRHIIRSHLYIEENFQGFKEMLKDSITPKTGPSRVPFFANS